MKPFIYVMALLLSLVLLADSTKRHVMGNQESPHAAPIAGTEVLLGRSANGIEVWKFDGTQWRQLPSGPPWSDAAGWDAPQYYSTIQTGDIDGDGRKELLARGASGIEVWKFDGTRWQQLPSGPPWSDAAGWDAPQYYSTIQTGDINGDGREELLARSANGIEVWKFAGSEWQQLPGGPPWSDAAGWNAPQYYSTIQTGYIAGYEKEELLARSASGIEMWALNQGEWEQLPGVPFWNDAGGWNKPQYYSTIQTLDMYRVPWEQLLARHERGIDIWTFNGFAWSQIRGGPTWSDASGWDAPEYYSTIQTGYLDGSYVSIELLARNASHVEVWQWPGWQELPHGPSWSDAGGWNEPQYYSTIQTGDIDGDGNDELLGRNAGYVEVWEFDGNAWQQLSHGPSWGDAAGWNAPQYYSTIQTAQIEGFTKTFMPIILRQRRMLASRFTPNGHSRCGANACRKPAFGARIR